MTTLATGLEAGVRGSWAVVQGRLYYCDDFNRMFVVERPDVAANSAGIAAPAAQIGPPNVIGGGNVDIGDHLVRYRYYNEKTGYMSNPSPARTVTVTAASSLVFSMGASSDIVPSSDPKVTHIWVEITPAGNGTYYRGVKVSNSASSATVNLTDLEILASDPTSLFGDFGHEQPPPFRMLIEHRQRLFGWGAYTYTRTSVTVSGTTLTGTNFSPLWVGRVAYVNGGTTAYTITAATTTTLTVDTAPGDGSGRTIVISSPIEDMLYWSASGYPESWKEAGRARQIMQGVSDRPTAMMSLYGDLYLFGQRTMLRLVQADVPERSMLSAVPTNMGAWNMQTQVFVDGSAYGWGASGMWKIQGILPRRISRPIETTLNTLVDTAQSDEFHAVFDPVERVIMWFFTRIGETEPQDAVCYDVDGGQWSFRRWDQPILASALVAPNKVVLSGSNGYSWQVVPDQFDGVSDGLYSADTGSTTTDVVVTDSVDASLIGYMLRTGGENRRITAASGNTLTVTPALSSAPTVDAEVFVGRIETILETKWFDGSGLLAKRRPIGLFIEVVPGSAAAKLKVQIYRDFQSSPVVMTAGSADTFPDGVTVTPGSSIIEVDLDAGSADGFVKVPVPSVWSRVLKAKVTTDTPIGGLQILDVRFADAGYPNRELEDTKE